VALLEIKFLYDNSLPCGHVTVMLGMMMMMMMMQQERLVFTANKA
jgi:hypothetical protein